MSKIFITGATGYVGGQVLQELVKSHPEVQFRALVRDANKARGVTALSDKIQIVSGTLEDAEIVAHEAAEADIVLNLAAAANLSSVEAIHEGLSARTASNKPAYWIQISGASALGAGEVASKEWVPGSASDLTFDNLDGVDDFRNHIRNNPSRTVDNYMVEAAAKSPQLRIAHVLPPIIYGKGAGPANRKSVQIPSLVSATLLRKRGLQVGLGLSRWGAVHIEDLGHLFVLLVENALLGGSDEHVWGPNGVYLTAASEHAFGDISRIVARTAREQGYLESDEVDVLDRSEADELLPHGSYLYGTNARGNARREKKLLGWTPRDESLEAEISRVVAAEARFIGLAL